MLPMIFGVPLLQMLVLVFAATFDMKKIDMVVVDKDLSETSRELIAKFDGIPFFHLETAVPDESFGEDMLLTDDASTSPAKQPISAASTYCRTMMGRDGMPVTRAPNGLSPIA